MIFIDTSAFLALVHRADANHQNAVECWENLIEAGKILLTNNYVVVESVATIQNRSGLDSVKQLQMDLLPFVDIEWVDEEQHTLAIESVLTTNRRNLSLVDCSAFNTMRRLGISTVFAFDEHFREQGFNVIP